MLHQEILTRISEFLAGLVASEEIKYGAEGSQEMFSDYRSRDLKRLREWLSTGKSLKNNLMATEARVTELKAELAHVEKANTIVGDKQN